jgi:SMODS and SLOG-associating 2TM effector domain 3/SMODS and SLOG-associating 2TM effector domain 1
LKFREQDYPAVFLAADRASSGAQEKYLSLTRGTLILLVAGAGFAAASAVFAFDSIKPAFAVISALLLAGSLLLTLYLKAQKPEQLWYGGRAVAESAKSMAWRYMTQAAPYLADPSAAGVDQKFVSFLESIVKERKQLAFGFGGEFTKQPQISDRMRAVRASTLAERCQVYLTERICDQRVWYGDQAKNNRLAENRYFKVVFMSQFAALAAAIALVRWPGSTVRLTGFFASLASALIAWLQLKQHKELAQSYSVAELELGFIEEKARHVTTEKAFSDFVSDAENAISREHTLWIARRDRS